MDEAVSRQRDRGTGELPAGVRYMPGYLSDAEQAKLYAEIQQVIAAAPLYVPTMPRSGRAFSVAMTNCGGLGWVSDAAGGYRYQSTHPVNGAAWPDLPERLSRIWFDAGGYVAPAEACLVNLYRARARLGSHADRDERDSEAPVVSVSLGDDAVFHVGGLRRQDPKVRLVLRSGDVVVLGGPARFAYHGIDRVISETSKLVAGGGRINLTLRRVNPPA